MPVNSSDTRQQQLDHCRAQLKGGSRSFHAAAFLLPSNIREPATALYAFCRMADDMIDGPGDADESLAELHRRIDAIFDQQPEDFACDQAMADVVKHHMIPKTLLLALLEGFRWDSEGREYPDLDSLFEYATRVAGTVGVMMAVLMGVRDKYLLARAADLGVAMQLTNIARDVGEDATLGRVYLPRNWLLEAGTSPEELLENPRFSKQVGSVVARLLETADRLYERADSGLFKLPIACRPSMYAARLLYSSIGGQITRNGFDSVSSRAVVSSKRKLLELTRLHRAFWSLQTGISSAPLQQTAYLVTATIDHIDSVTRARNSTTAGVGDKVIWVLDLFEQLHQRDMDSDRVMGMTRRTETS